MTAVLMELQQVQLLLLVDVTDSEQMQQPLVSASPFLQASLLSAKNLLETIVNMMINSNILL